MKYAAWVIGLVAGVTGCSGTIGGDLRDYNGGKAGGNGGPPDGESAGISDYPDNAGAGGSAPAAGRADGGASAAGFAGASDPPAGTGGVDSSGGGAPTAGHGGAAEPSSCNSMLDAWIAFDSDAYEFQRDVYVARPDGTQMKRLTTSPSADTEPYFAPSGNRLSFTSDRSGTQQIYLLDLSTGAVTQVTHRAKGANQSSFSADGNLIAFHSGSSVYTIKPDGSDETLIAMASDETSIPTGSYASPRFIGNDQLVFDSNFAIEAINLDKTNFRYIIDQRATITVAPTVSPLTNEIAYAASCFSEVEGEAYYFSIWITSSTTSSVVCTGRRLTPEHERMHNSRPSWGPASTFAYERTDPWTDRGRIMLINLASGSVPCAVTSDTIDSRNPSWSVEGLELEFGTP
jgi:dipeptidyl aminopeptidase/acylaminoacyl peptidase